MDVDQKRAASSNSTSGNRGTCPDWAGCLEPGVVQLIGCKLDCPQVPGAVHISSLCRAWRAAAQQTPGLSVTWHSRQLMPGEDGTLDQQRVEGSFRPWLARWAPQVDSFVITTAEIWGGADMDAVWCLLNDTAKAAAAAGQPLRLQRLQLPFTPCSTWGLPTALALSLPFLRHLALTMDTWPQGRQPDQVGPFLQALSGLAHLQVLEVGLRVDTPWVQLDQQAPLRCWGLLLEAAPKQLQRLSVQIIHESSTYKGLLEVAYTWEPLAPFTQLQRLQLGDIAAGHDLSPLAQQLPSLTSLGIRHTGGGGLERLAAVKGLLQDLHVENRGLLPVDEQHLEQLTHLTSLTITWGKAGAPCPLPQAVAAGLHKLDWTLETASRDSSSSSSSSGGGKRPAGQQLAQCSSKLRDLQLRGAAWTRDDVGAAAALRQLTGLTSFGLHCVRAPVSTTAMDLGSWPSQPPLQHLKQLRSLALPVELLGTQQPWLGGLVHLTRLQLQLAVGWSKPAASEGGWVPQDVFGGAQGKVQANLVSCWPGLKVLAVHFDLLYGPRGRQQDVHPVVPAVEGWLKQQLPGVQLVLTWEAGMDRSKEPHIDLGSYYRDRPPQYTADRGSSQDAMASLMADSLDVPLHMAMYSDESEDDLDDLFDKYLDLVMN